MADYVAKRRPKGRLEKAVLDATAWLWKIPSPNVVDAQGYADCLATQGFENVKVESVGELTIPGYYYEQRKPAFRAHKIRTQGFMIGGLGFVLDIACFQAYQMGLIDYVLATAEKPHAGHPETAASR